ncbi:MFS transporter [Sporichthya polymorpha]|uniref:MFS transporter n=1 Tax=Sporichthya polymorpha TaxID=35751 RepID=UPI00036F6125|nr:MFS transporter [Sporichthya polymorpha]
MLLPVLIYCGLCTAVISSLGVLLIPTIAADQGVSLAAGQWVLTVSSFTAAVSTPVLGRLADRGDPRKVLLGALGVVAFGSVLAATATEFAVLLVGRALQGVTFGIVPVTMSLARRHLPVERLQSGIAALSVTAVTGIGLGYPVTGAVAEYGDYRVAFWIAVAFAGSALLVVPFVVPPSPPLRGAGGEPFDVGGAVLLGVGLGAGLLALAESPRWGWDSPAALGLLAVSVVVLALWARWEVRAPAPLIRLDLLRLPDVRLAQLSALCFWLAMFGSFAATGTLAQTPAGADYGPHLTAFGAGFVILPLSIGSQLSSRLGVWLSRRLGPRAVLVVGAVAVVVANSGLCVWHGETWQLLLGLLVLGVGVGVALSTMPLLLLGAVPGDQLGSSIAANAVLRQVGGSIASAMVGALIAAHTVDGLATDDAFRWVFGIGALIGVALMISLVVATLRSRTAPTA